MRTICRLALVLLAVVLVSSLPTALVAADEAGTESVDCTDPDPKKHDSINEALSAKGDPLTIEISGTCLEDVEIRRDNVTLIGTDPTLDGIQAVDTESIRGAAVYIRNARFVRLENLKLTGAVWSGLRIHSSDTGNEVVNCRAEGNGRWGIAVGQSPVAVEDSVLSGNAVGGLVVGNAANVTCTNCVLDNPLIGALATQDASLTLSASTMTAGFGAVLASGTGKVYVDGGFIDGPFIVEADSLVWLEGAVQTGNPSGSNFVDVDSTLLLSGNSSMLGDTFIDNFSKLAVRGTSSHSGNLICAGGSDVFCDNPAANVGGSSNCPQCPKP